MVSHGWREFFESHEQSNWIHNRLRSIPALSEQTECFMSILPPFQSARTAIFLLCFILLNTYRSSPCRLVHLLQNLSFDLKVDKVIIADSSLVFDKIINTFHLNEDYILMEGKILKFTGSRLKAFGQDSGSCFVPLEEDGGISKDESKWTTVNTEAINTNRPKTLDFYVPDDLTLTEYCIVLRTRYSSGDKELKILASAVRKTVMIVAYKRKITVRINFMKMQLIQDFFGK